ncbi:restriction endonuclease subunit S [Hymenobacter sp. J193]|uniref:restriction endonuclease subunit S n=1 Tax=Hymenobacter sp. J193 TaxID=2898429 RepID=UPI002151989C|nr:restriction endonuclease subunit S [Hymenobacter sp. J193]MCR5888013.1 restriction endonuclease subunit S [Hymenobacter sp. J193]
MQENQELPKGWIEVEIGKIADVLGGKRLPAGHDYVSEKTSHPYLRVKDFDNGSINQSDLKYISPSTAALISRYTITADDVYISIAGSIGFTGIIPPQLNGANLTENAAKISNLVGAEPSYVHYFFQSSLGQNQVKDSTASTTQPKLALFRIQKISIPLAPLPEQRRIVAKLEELFSRLDAGVATLRQTQAQLKRYRQSVLHAAVTGELTRAWRAAHSEPAESGAALLQRIRAERRAQWEAAQLAKRGGQLPLGDTWKKKYEEPAAPDTSELPELPQGWVRATFSQLGSWKGGGTPSKSNPSFWTNGDVLWVSPKDMKSWRLNDSEDKITEEAIEGSTAKLIDAPSLLFVVRSGILRRILPVAILETAGTVNQDIKALTPFVPELTDYLLYVVQCLNNDIRTSCMKGGTTVESIEVGQLQEYAVPLPSMEEQAQIIQEVESRLSVLDKLELTLKAELIRAERLRQSILHRAFTGRLVPQHAADEPAAALLARLQDTPAAQPAAKAKRGRKARESEQTTLDL